MEDNVRDPFPFSYKKNSPPLILLVKLKLSRSCKKKKEEGGHGHSNIPLLIILNPTNIMPPWDGLESGIKNEVQGSHGK